MKRPMVLIALLAIGLVLGSSAWAYGGGKCTTGDCELSGKHGNMEKKGHSEGQCPIAAKLMKKSGFLLQHKADLGLTDAQVKTIKDLQLQSEKDSAQQGADMKVFMLDLESKLKDDNIDVAGTNALIDKNTAAFATAAKSNVEAYVKLKSVLTPEQSAKMKEIWKQKKDSFKKEKHHS